MYAFRAFDQMFMARYVEQKLVWPFEYGGHGTRFTILRIANLFATMLFLAATLVSPLIPETHFKLLYMSFGVGFMFLVDGWLTRSEKTTRDAKGEPNAYRDRCAWRMWWLVLSLAGFLVGLVAFSESYIEGICRMLLCPIGALGLYVYSADPLPEKWLPRLKHLNW